MQAQEISLELLKALQSQAKALKVSFKELEDLQQALSKLEGFQVIFICPLAKISKCVHCVDLCAKATMLAFTFKDTAVRGDWIQ